MIFKIHYKPFVIHVANMQT